MDRLVAFVLAALLAVALAALGLTAWHAHGLQRELTAVRDEATANQLRAVREARTEERRVQTTLQEAIDVQTQQVAVARADADAAGAAVDRLRQRAAAAVHPTLPGSPEVARICQAEGGALRLADALGTVAGEARRLAADLDDSRAAGLLCERVVDALTPPEQEP